MNDERYILARLKAQLLHLLKEKDVFEYRSKLIQEILDLIIAIETTTVLDMELDDLIGKEQEATE